MNAFILAKHPITALDASHISNDQMLELVIGTRTLLAGSRMLK